ncbi:uncharacterized protein MONBRDRAFT_39170 [Monosiga brevicollis MX1]|uniref:Beta-catenin-like protein 1 N-terminal domain-containing protein n=1 Tax=Monosiga brevicollis TaxID=81824 RepID=A9VCM8_MONBE|nr:uncharacterized protein MONBRDRAFT_39170 [Monosiga brevicollis MX1]EDQ84675.1 predicted protein [Monosiga brevicollis MX1]|eukprot:XP_001750461.1 hypothetical protein [Monosiga brevicollis MX1]
MKKLAVSLERKLKKNQQMRIKYPDEPLKFMDSEVALHSELAGFSLASTAPEYYHVLVKYGTAATLMTCLNHENTDIAAAAVTVLMELTDTEALVDDPRDADALIDALLANDFMEQALALLARFDEAVSDEAEAVHNVMASFVLALSHLMNDGSRLHRSIKVGTDSGLEVLLRIVAGYKKVDPASDQEGEFLENTFDAICSCLMEERTYPKALLAPAALARAQVRMRFTGLRLLGGCECLANKNLFVELEGVQLMVLLLRKKQAARFGALRVLDHITMSGDASLQACNIFIEHLGLKSLFPCFMKTPRSKSFKAVQGDKAVYEEHVCSIVAALFREIQEPPELRARLLGKFVEDNMAKCVRLAELHAFYAQKLAERDQLIAEERAQLEQHGEWDDAMEAEFYVDRLGDGLSMLQLIDYVVASVIVGCQGQMYGEVAKLFNIKGARMTQVFEVLSDYADNIGDEDKGEASQAKQVRALLLQLRQLAAA